MSKNTALVSDEPRETSPLIEDVDEQGVRSNVPVEKERDKEANRVIIILMLVVAIGAVAEEMIQSPMTRILEAVICYRHYEEADPSKILIGRKEIGPGAIGGVDEIYCKVNAVQSEMAMLRGWIHLFESVPGLLLAVPVGWAADRYGRKRFTMLIALGLFCREAWIAIVTWFWQAFDIRAIWFSTLSNFLGGGDTVFNALFFVIVSDVASEERRADIFLRLGAFNLAAMLATPPLAAWLMQYNPWIPELTGNVLQALSVLVFSFCPETLGFHKPSATQPHADGNSESDEIHADNVREPESQKQGLMTLWLHKIRDSTSFLHNDWRVLAMMVTFFTHSLINHNRLLVLQYFSKRYEITISMSTLLLQVRHGMILVLYMFILPYITKVMLRRLAKYPNAAQRKDLYLARASQAAWTIGWTLVGLSPNIPLAAISLAIGSLGQGMTLLLRSLLVTLLEPHHIARAYSVISVVEICGNMLGSPALAGVFSLGLSLSTLR